MRIIRGKYARRKLLVSRLLEDRPTMDRVKEALMSILDTSILWDEAVVLDACSGSGSVGFELASMGSKVVYCVEQNPAYCDTLLQNKEHLSDDTVEVVQKDILAFLKSTPLSFDCIFMDPPYLEHALIKEAVEIIRDRNLLRDEFSVLVVEHSKDLESESWVQERQDSRTYGNTVLSFFGR